MKNKKIMVIEDDSDIRDIMVEALLLEDYEVLQAENGKVALDRLKSVSRENLPGCIVVDLMMPVMNGEQFIEEVKSDYSSIISGIPLIVASAKGNLSSRKPIKGVVGHLAKPVDLWELYSVIERYYR